MKVRILSTLALLLILTLSACMASAQDIGGDPVSLTDQYEGAIPVQLQLILGTFKLEGTELAVSGEQAGRLLPLWRALRSLSASDSAAPEEIEALIDQIENTMSSGQIRTISAMALTREDILALASEMGLGGRPDGQTGGPQGGPPGGGFPGGGPPRGGPGQGALGENLNPEQVATLRAERGGSSNAAGRAGGFLVDPLIQLLETRSASS